MTDFRAQLEAQQAIQDLIAWHAPLDTILPAVCRMLERQFSGAKCTVMLQDPGSETISLVAGDTLSQAFFDAMQRIPVVDDMGTCGTAACRNDTVISEDIQQDPRWESAHELARAEGVCACLSTPVQTRDGRVAGTFAVYFDRPKAPSAEEVDAVQRFSALVSLALERDRDHRTIAESEQLYQSLFTQHPDAVYALDLDGHYQSGNIAMAALTGLDEAAMVGRHYTEILGTSERERSRQSFAAARDGVPDTVELPAHDNGASWRDLEITHLPIVMDDNVTGVFGVARDITERKRHERELHLLHRAVENSVNGVFIVDAAQSHMPVIYSNATFLQLTGYPREEMIGRNFLQIRGPETSDDAVNQVQQAVSQGSDVQVPLLSYRRDGTSFWSELFVSRISDDSNNKHFVGVLHDISAQKEYEARLAYYASHDLLTGLPNRQSFETQLEENVALARRRGQTLAVLSVDIDDFRPINDSLGHTTGDRLLVAIAGRLESVLDDGQLLARLGGDEFVVLVPAVTNQEQVVALAESILDALTQLYVVDDHRLQVSGSVGIAASDRPMNAAGDLIHQANQAMFRAKQRGRNTWEWHAGDMTPEITERVTLRRELEEAVLREEFELYYQPLVDAVTHRVQSFEALVRWRHPERGLLAPDRFIPLAEQTGQIVSLGRLVLRQAVRDMAELERITGSTLPVAVNISPLQFRRETFLDDVRQALDLYGMAPQRLTIELTESVLMNDTDSALATLAELNRMGIQVAIDDFGTGFSSLSYIRQLTISTVKLDGSFIRDILTDRSSGAVVQGTITMAHHMNLAVVAERVETAAQATDLQHRGCNLLQGFLFARPVPMSELRTYLAKPIAWPCKP